MVGQIKVKKILAFVYTDKNNKFLALRSDPHPKHGEGGWFVITGGVESGESFEAAVKREVKEETNLDVIEIFPLNWGSIYEWNGETCKELNFISFVAPRKISLNEEHVEFEWLKLNEFVKRINWLSSKAELKKVLKLGIKKKLAFNKLKLDDFRK